MAESYSPRMGVRRWTDNGDTFTRDELDLTHANIEARAAIFGNGTLAARPVAGVQGRFYLLDATEPSAAIRGQLYYDTGVAWVMVQFDLTAILATKAAVSHAHLLADLPVANNGEISTTKLVRADDARLTSDWVPGDILWSAATTRVGFVKADGAQYNTVDQPGLFAKIGYTYGGAGGVFNVPNANDRSLVASSAGGKALGASGGSATKSVVTANLPPHSHTINHGHVITDPTHLHDFPDLSTTWAWGARDPGDSDIYLQTAQAAAGTHPSNELITQSTRWQGTLGVLTGVTVQNHNGSSGNTGTGTALDVMNPWLALNCFIKT